MPLDNEFKMQALKQGPKPVRGTMSFGDPIIDLLQQASGWLGYDPDVTTTQAAQMVPGTEQLEEMEPAPYGAFQQAFQEDPLGQMAQYAYPEHYPQIAAGEEIPKEALTQAAFRMMRAGSPEALAGVAVREAGGTPTQAELAETISPGLPEVGGGVKGASLLFGSKAARKAMEQAIRALRRAKVPGGEQGLGVVGGLLRTTGKGAVLTDIPRKGGPELGGLSSAGTFTRDVSDVGLVAARRNQERIDGMIHTADRSDAYARRTEAAGGDGSEFKKNATVLRKEAAHDQAQHDRHLKRLQTHRRQQIEKYEIKPETPEIAVAPRFSKTPDVELHELLHAGEKGMFPGRTGRVRELLEKSGVGDWLRAQEMGGAAIYPEAWTRMPGEQFAESLTAIARGQNPGLTAKEAKKLGSELGLELEKLRLAPWSR